MFIADCPERMRELAEFTSAGVTVWTGRRTCPVEIFRSAGNSTARSITAFVPEYCLPMLRKAAEMIHERVSTSSFPPAATPRVGADDLESDVDCVEGQAAIRPLVIGICTKPSAFTEADPLRRDDRLGTGWSGPDAGQRSGIM